MNTFNLDKHLQQEHMRTPFSEYLKEIVYGGNDGIVTTFAVVAGFAGAQQDPLRTPIPVVSVLIFGLANLFADGLSMGLGSFLSLRAEQDVYRSEKAKEAYEIKHAPQAEYEETIEILQRNSFTKRDAVTLASLYRSYPAYWTEFMMKHELNMSNPEHEKPLFIACSTFISFLVFGSIPLIPYMVQTKTHVFTISIICTAFALLLLGSLRGFVTKRKPLRGIAETFFVGTISAFAAYLVGTLFQI